jgi:molybdopterin/thiamine biosynthesis adenylyltransferase
MQHMDESLYSRQLYAIGKETTQKLINSKIFVYGIRGPIIETLKNLILCGVGEITLYEEEILSNVSQKDIDLNYNYYLTQKRSK